VAAVVADAFLAVAAVDDAGLAILADLVGFCPFSGGRLRFAVSPFVEIAVSDDPSVILSITRAASLVVAGLLLVRTFPMNFPRDVVADRDVWFLTLQTLDAVDTTLFEPIKLRQRTLPRWRLRVVVDLDFAPQ